MIATAIVLASLAADVLVAGKQAPAFSPEKFVKGMEFKSFERGKVYVVEFWATWCGPCVSSMPHLSKLQKDNPDIVVVGVAGFERASDAAAREKKVVDFLAGPRGSSVGFPVAVDTDGSMGREWMEAAKQRGIPCSFVVGKDGKIAFIGFPNAELDEAVKKAKAAGPAAPPAGDAPPAKGSDAPKAP